MNLLLLASLLAVISFIIAYYSAYTFEKIATKISTLWFPTCLSNIIVDFCPKEINSSTREDLFTETHMATFYIIHSKSTDAFYTGSSNNFEMQFEQHKNGHFPKGFKSTAKDWVAYFLIHDIDIDTANRIVKHVKKNKSQEFFESLKADGSMADKLVEEFTNVRSHPESNQEPS